MSNLIVCVSVSHGNTRQVADAIAEVIDARVVVPEDVTSADLDGSELVGFGSGIYNLRVHPRLRTFVRSLPVEPRGDAFVFGTSGMPALSGPVVRDVRSRGFTVVGTFFCRGHDTVGPLRAIGGIHKGRPNTEDLMRARTFAAGLRH